MTVWPLKSVVISLVRIENSFRCWYGWWPAWSMDSRTGDPSHMSWVVRFTYFFVCALWILNFQYMFSWLLLDVCLGCKVPPCCPSTQKGGVSAGVQLIPRQQKVQKIWVSCLAYHACLRWHVFLQPCRRWDFCCHHTWIVQVRGWGGVRCGGVGWGGLITSMYACGTTSCYVDVTFLHACTSTQCYVDVTFLHACTSTQCYVGVTFLHACTSTQCYVNLTFLHACTSTQCYVDVTLLHACTSTQCYVDVTFLHACTSTQCYVGVTFLLACGTTSTMLM